MIMGYAWYWWVGGFSCIVAGIGILCDGIGQGWVHKFKRKPKDKPVGRHAKTGELEVIHVQNEKIGVTYTLVEQVKVIQDMPPVPLGPRTQTMAAVTPENRPEWVTKYLEEHGS